MGLRTNLLPKPEQSRAVQPVGGMTQQLGKTASCGVELRENLHATEQSGAMPDEGSQRMVPVLQEFRNSLGRFGLQYKLVNEVSEREKSHSTGWAIGKFFP